ncbi:hypothetical protein NDU88_007869 [Pleurodeles waltl]|uniref:Uncharacterized protein n=1 Tax=Pleurodeles waltl TaxID=8319 RepID=A0AAV7NBF7_PLEWA|nr:hypothetical protein NDU88_007869 [Pleurodeles waltl]
MGPGQQPQFTPVTSVILQSPQQSPPPRPHAAGPDQHHQEAPAGSMWPRCQTGPPSHVSEVRGAAVQLQSPSTRAQARLQGINACPPEETRPCPPGPRSGALTQPHPPRLLAQQHQYPRACGLTYLPVRPERHPQSRVHAALQRSRRAKYQAGAPRGTTTRGSAAIRERPCAKPARQAPGLALPPRSVSRPPLSQVSQQRLRSPLQLDVSLHRGAAPTSAVQPVPVGEMSNAGSCPAEPHKVADICRMAKPRPPPVLTS